MWNPQLFVGMFLRVGSLWSVYGYISQGLRSLISLWMYFPGFWSVFPRICLSLAYFYVRQSVGSIWSLCGGTFHGVCPDVLQACLKIGCLCCNCGCCVLRPEFSYFFLGLCPRMRSLSSRSVCLSNLQALLSVGVCPRVWSLIHLRIRIQGCQIGLWVSIRMWDSFSLMVACLRCDSLSLYICPQSVVSGLSVAVSQVTTYFPLI